MQYRKWRHAPLWSPYRILHGYHAVDDFPLTDGREQGNPRYSLPQPQSQALLQSQRVEHGSASAAPPESESPHHSLK